MPSLPDTYQHIDLLPLYLIISQKYLMQRRMATQAFSLTSRIQLNDGNSMPRIHLGVYLMSGSEASSAAGHALDTGYRAFDSAQMYRNEKQVGKAISKYLEAHPEIKREDIHYTSKLASNSDYKTARKSISQSVKECGLGYIDLFLLHSPYGGKQKRLDSWKAVEDAVKDGEARIGGVSNFGEKHVRSTKQHLFLISYVDVVGEQIDEILSSNPRLKPAVNQIEVHP